MHLPIPYLNEVTKKGIKHILSNSKVCETYLYDLIIALRFLVPAVAQSIEKWVRDWKVIGLNP